MGATGIEPVFGPKRTTELVSQPTSPSHGKSNHDHGGKREREREREGSTKQLPGRESEGRKLTHSMGRQEEDKHLFICTRACFDAH